LGEGRAGAPGEVVEVGAGELRFEGRDDLLVAVAPEARRRSSPEGGKTGGLPRRGRSSSPAKRCPKNRFRHFETTSRPQRNRAAIWSLPSPSAAISTI
jgi:hypothetical protein